VQWTLPSRPGLYTLDVVAFDGKGGYARSNVALRVDGRGVLFSGFVDATDAPAVPGASVEVNGRPATTDSRGWFELYVPDADRYVLNIRKQGYGLASRIYDKSVSGGRWTLTRATTVTVDPSGAIDVEDRRDRRNCPGPGANGLNWRSFPELLRSPQWQDGKGNLIEPPDRQAQVPLPQPGQQRECGPGIRLQIPANALQDASGNPPAGPVSIDLTTIDLESPEQMPGDYSVRPAGGGGVQVMQSYGAGIVEIYDGATEYDLRPGAQALLTIPVDPGQLAAGGPIPPSIPILFYDEVNGIWIEEGSAPLNLAGTAYLAELSHFSAINADTLKNDQACVRILSPSLPASYELEVQVPQGGGAAPKVLHATITNTPPHQHVIYNLPTNTNIVLVPVPVGFDPLGDVNPFGVFVVNTGGAQNPTNPNLPAGPPYVACSTEVVLSQLSIPDEPLSGEFLHGLYTFAATRLEEASPGVPLDNALNTALISTTIAYYDQIDPRNLRETLQEFRDTNGFTTTTEVRAVYANGGDLGFGRDMHCAKQLADDLQYDVACYVTNYGSIDTPDAQDAEDASNPLAPAVATVAMEYSRIEDPGADGSPIVYGDPQRVVKFYVYNGAGDDLLFYANLDGLGLRPIPQLCQVCHSGDAPRVITPTGLITDNIPLFENRNDVKLGSRFIPFDLKYFVFGDAPFTKALQQDEFRLLNEDIVSRTLPGGPIDEIIAEMYDPGPDQNESFVVEGWDSGPLTRTTYREVVAPTCRMCHTTITYAPDLNFQTSSDAVDLLASIENRVCVQHVMPHARATHRIFWRSFNPSMPATLQLFGDAFGAGTGWNGELCGDFTAGGDTPVTFYEANVQPIFNTHCVSCHAGGSPPAGLDLTADESYGDLVNVNSTEVPAQKRVLPGDAANSYLHEKITDDTPAVGSRMPPGSALSAADIATITNWINSGAAP
jgi:mono/diheme cytochrome c family protein